MLQDKLPYMKLQGILLIAKVGTLEEWKDENVRNIFHIISQIITEKNDIVILNK